MLVGQSLFLWLKDSKLLIFKKISIFAPMKELCTYTKFDLNDRKLLRGGVLSAV